jgi:tetratricopeptide (TPR) repeat protein
MAVGSVPTGYIPRKPQIFDLPGVAMSAQHRAHTDGHMFTDDDIIRWEPPGNWASLAEVRPYEGEEALWRLAREHSAFFGDAIMVGCEPFELSFYRSFRLLNLIYARSGQYRRVFALDNGEATWWLNGESSPIHDVNDQNLQLGDNEIEDYLRFFLYFLRADAGGFVLIEKPEDITLPVDDSGELSTWATLVDWHDQAKPLEVQADRDAEDRWLVDVTLAYGRQFANTVIAVASDGQVEMTDDDPIELSGEFEVPSVPSLDLAEALDDLSEEDAIEAADEVLDGSRRAIYRGRLGRRLRALGRKERALGQYQDAVSSAPENLAYLQGLELTLLHMGRVDQAISAAKDYRVNIGDSDADQARHHHELGELLREFGWKAKALQEHERAVEFAPNGTYWERLGDALFDLGRVDEAIARATLVPTNDLRARYCNRLGDRLRALNRLTEACGQYRKAMKLDPAKRRYRWGLVFTLLLLDLVEDAVAEARHAIDRYPTIELKARDHHGLARLLRAAGKGAEATEHYERAVILDPQTRYVLDLGHALLDDGHVRKALERCERAWAKDPSDPADYAALLARVAGRTREATSLYQQALAHAKSDARHAVLEAFSYHLFAIGDHQQVISLYQDAIGTDRSDAALVVRLSNVYLKLGRYGDALKLLDDVDGCLLWNRDIARSRASILLHRLGRTDQAVDAYHRALDASDTERIDVDIDLAGALARDGQWRQAQDRFMQAISTYAERRARCVWGQALYDDGKYGEAMEQFTACPAERGSYYHAVCRCHLAWAWYRQHRFFEARDQADRAIKLFELVIARYDTLLHSSPSAPTDYGGAWLLPKYFDWDLADIVGQSHSSIGALSAYRSDDKIAISAYESALTYDPCGLYSAAALAVCYAGSPEGGELLDSGHRLTRARCAANLAQRLLGWRQRSVRRSPVVRSEQIAVAQAFTALGDYRGATSLLKRARDGRNPQVEIGVEMGLAAASVARRDYHRGAEHFRRAAVLEPTNLRAIAGRADCLFKLDLTDQARNQYQRAIGIAEYHVESVVGLADVHAAIAKKQPAKEQLQCSYRDAINGYDKALEASRSGWGSMTFTPTEQASVLCSRGCVKAMMFDPDTPNRPFPRILVSAREDLRKALTLDPNLYEAAVTADKIDAYRRQFRGATAWVNKGAPGVTFVAALALFVLALFDVHYKWLKIDDLSGTIFATLTVGALVVAMAGISLPKLSRLKAAGVEMEIKSTGQIDTQLGITATTAPIQLTRGIGPDLSPPPVTGHRWSEGVSRAPRNFLKLRTRPRFDTS